MFRVLILALLTALLSLMTGRGLDAQTFHGPTPYLQRSDSPLIPLTTGLYVEDLEDGAFNAPGVSSTPAVVVAPGAATDSVDADDGSIDGSGNGGHSWFQSSGPSGITFTFDPAVLGGSPTHVGLAWTDGTGDVWFEAFEPGGQSLGVIGPAAIPDNSILGTTAEDHFFGVSHAGGIGSMRVWNTSGGIEVDHIQYSYPGLILETSDAEVFAGDPLGLTTNQGQAGKLAILVAIDVNGAPLFQHLATSTFDASGAWTLSATVPPGLAGLKVGLLSLGAAATTGKLDLSNRLEIEFF